MKGLVKNHQEGVDDIFQSPTHRKPLVDPFQLLVTQPLRCYHTDTVVHLL